MRYFFGQERTSHEVVARGQRLQAATVTNDLEPALDIRDIATMLGCTPGAVHVRLSRDGVRRGTVPPPTRIGKRLLWWPEAVRQWRAQQVARPAEAVAPPRRGRPRTGR